MGQVFGVNLTGSPRIVCPVEEQDGSVTVPVTEFIGKGGDPFHSPQFSLARDESASMRVYQVAWDKYQLACKGILGFSCVKTDDQGNKWVSRVKPDVEVDWSRADGASAKLHGPYFLFANRVVEGAGHAKVQDGKGYKGTDGTARHNLARLKVEYRSQLYDILDDTDMKVIGALDEFGHPDESGGPGGVPRRYVTLLVDPRSDYQNIPRGANLVIVPGGTLPNVALTTPPGRIVPKYLLTLIWHDVPEAALGMRVYNRTLSGLGSIDLSIGKINHDDWIYPAGTMLLESARATPHTSPLGSRVYQAELHYSVVFPGQNYVPATVDQGPPPDFGFGYCSTDGKLHQPSYGVINTNLVANLLVLEVPHNFTTGQRVTVDRTFGGVVERQNYYARVFAGNTISLHNSRADASNNANLVPFVADLTDEVRVIILGNSIFDGCNMRRCLQAPRA